MNDGRSLFPENIGHYAPQELYTLMKSEDWLLGERLKEPEGKHAILVGIDGLLSFFFLTYYVTMHRLNYFMGGCQFGGMDNAR